LAEQVQRFGNFLGLPVEMADSHPAQAPFTSE